MKKTRLKEIIKEEIQKILSEVPLYNVTDKEGFNKAYEKFKDSNISKSKSLNTILDKLKDTGEVDTKELATQSGKDSATFNNPEIRKFINRPPDEKPIDKKTGEELIDFSPFLDVKSSRKPKPEEEKPSTPKQPKKPTSDKQDRPARKLSDMDDEDKEALKSMGTDKTSKELASTPEEKKEKFNLGIKFIKKYKDDKPKVDAYLKKAKEEYKFSKSMLDDLKRTAGRKVEA
jgi:predicted nucleotide-binding protein (sugar kinase/HSP70/actin superfamily)